MECFCSVQITFCFLGAQPQRRTVAVAAEQKGGGHRTAAGPRDGRRLLLTAGQQSRERMPKTVVTAVCPTGGTRMGLEAQLIQQPLHQPCLRNPCGWDDAFAHQGFAPEEYRQLCLCPSLHLQLVSAASAALRDTWNAARKITRAFHTVR